MKVRFLLSVLLRGRGSQGMVKQGIVKFLKEEEVGELGIVLLNIYLAGKGSVKSDIPINLAFIREREKLVSAEIREVRVFLIKGCRNLSVELACIEETLVAFQETKEALLKEDWVLEEEKDIKEEKSS
ncbi:MAG: hypothetical protein PHE24_06975 [Patescibacteria group bacterium]|nr:hypothetical protein [Patescibacteria group bacterium]